MLKSLNLRVEVLIIRALFAGGSGADFKAARLKFQVSCFCLCFSSFQQSRDEGAVFVLEPVQTCNKA